MNAEALLAVVVVAGVLVLLATSSIAPELVLVGAMLLLSITGILTSAEALAGFANPGVLSIGALFVVVAGLAETGAVAWLSQTVLRRPKTLAGAQVRLLTTTGLVSSVINNTPVVAMFIPIAQQWGTRYAIPVSKLLLPMNNVAILGGLCTLIGTSTNLAVNGLLQQRHPEAALSLFDLAWIGVPLTVLGILYSLVFSRLLPDRSPPVEQLGNAREYCFQVRVQAKGPLVGRSIAEVGLRNLRSAYVIEIGRRSRLITSVGPDEILEHDDILTCVGIVDAVKDLRKIPGLEAVEEQTYRLDLKNWQRQLVEIVLSKSSPLIGNTVRETNFRTEYRAAIISISRDGSRLQGKVGDVELRAGDTLLVEAGPDFIDKHRYNREFLLVSPVSDSQPADFRKAPIAAGILLLMIAANTAELLPLFEATLAAAGLMLATGCLSTRLARQSIEFSVLAAVAASYALGTALTKTGAAEWLGTQVVAMSVSEPMIALAAVYLITVVLTELITNNAAGVLMFPVALAVASAAHVSYLPFVVAVMVAASAGFITPIGYQTNLMVYGAGGYRFGDFVRFGLPLSIFVAIVSLWIIPRVWAF